MSTPKPILPISEISKRDLEFFMIVDRSYSMEGSRIASLNAVASEIFENDLPDILQDYPHVQLNVTVISFSNDVRFEIGPESVALEDVNWSNILVDGMTNTADAINALSLRLDAKNMPDRGLPPVCILISDGHCTQSKDEYQNAIDSLEQQPWGKRAVRLSIGIGDDFNSDELRLFMSRALRKEIDVLTAKTREQLKSHIRWASTTANKSSKSLERRLSPSPNISLFIQSIVLLIAVGYLSSLFCKGKDLDNPSLATRIILILEASRVTTSAFFQACMSHIESVCSPGSLSNGINVSKLPSFP